MSDEAFAFSSAREGLRFYLAKHLAHEAYLNERVCESCALGTVSWGHADRFTDAGGVSAITFLPHRVGGGKIVTLVADLSKDFKEYRCPECGSFEEFLGLRRRDLQ